METYLANYTLLFRCNETNELKKYADHNFKLYFADENEVFELTGCLSPCNKFEYAAMPTTDLRKDIPIPGWGDNAASTNQLTILFYFTAGRHEVREQVCKIHNDE